MMKNGIKYLIAGLSIVAAGLSLWLTYQKWTGQINSLAGCGGGSGCSNVLGSKWSLVFGRVPVSAFSFVIYIAVFLSLWIFDKEREKLWGVLFRRWAAWLFLWAALWFVLLQVIVLKTICPYCMTMHGVGGALAILIFMGDAKKLSGVPIGRFRLKDLKVWLPVTAAICVVVLALVQYFGPEPSSFREELVAFSSKGREIKDIHAEGKGRKVSFLKGRKRYCVDCLPHIGSADAEFVMVEYFDYTCEACRKNHELLKVAIARHPKKLAVIVLPTPLNRSCNPYLPQGVKNEKSACELAKLALKVWRLAPEKFETFHNNLFEMQGMPYEVAKVMAIGLVGEKKWTADGRGEEGERALKAANRWVSEVLKQDVEDYKKFAEKTPVMPKLLIKGSVLIQGGVNNEEALEKLLKKYFF